VLIHHVFGEVNGKQGIWGHAIGGMGAITQAMAAAAASRGVEISLNSGVSGVLVEGNQARGVELQDGTIVRAKCVISNLNPKLLFQKLIPKGVLQPEFANRIDAFKCGSGTFRMNVALKELPRFTCLPEAGSHLSSGIIMAPTLGYMERAFFDAKTYGWSREPIVEILLPSTVDSSLAPEGQHVASLFCQHVAPVLPR
jgi:phytoene dehydrogenase-like protein